MRVRDVEPLVRKNIGNRAQRAWRHDESEVWRACTGSAVYSHTVNAWLAIRWSDDVNVMTRRLKAFCQIMEMKLEASDAWVIPVGDESDLHE
jgi:hypothetical protein